MGTNVAPSYANIFMDRFERNALKGFYLKPFYYGTFIDNIFMIWEHGLDTLKEFINYMNSLHPTIKFTFEYSQNMVSFLDTTVCMDHHTRKVYTKLCTKPTDSHSYLHRTSAHYHPCKTKGPYGQFLRIRRICARSEDFHLEAN